MSVKKPELKFGPNATEDILIWHNEDYKPVSKYAIYGDTDCGQFGKRQVAFIKWYEETRLVPTSEDHEREIDNELITKLRTEQFKWAQEANPNVTYAEFLERHRIVTFEPSEDGGDRLPTDWRGLPIGRPERVPSRHFELTLTDTPDE